MISQQSISTVTLCVSGRLSALTHFFPWAPSTLSAHFLVRLTCIRNSGKNVNGRKKRQVRFFNDPFLMGSKSLPLLTLIPRGQGTNEKKIYYSKTKRKRKPIHLYIVSDRQFFSKIILWFLSVKYSVLN